MHRLCGERYGRDKPLQGRYRRWGTNPGSIRIQGERVPLEVPRVRDVQAGTEQPLASYQQMKQPVAVDAAMQQALVLSLAQRDYQRVASAFVDGFGLSQASVTSVSRAQSAGAGSLRGA